MKCLLPYTSKRLDILTDSLIDFYDMLDQIINFYQESLMMYCVIKDSSLPQYIPEKKGKVFGYLNYTIPKIEINGRDKNYLDFYPVRLFRNTIVNIASCYEIYLRDLAEEIYHYNKILLEKKRKQYSKNSIASLKSVRNSEEQLVEQLVNDIIHGNYSDKVKKFENAFNVRLHSMKSPLSLFEMHHFFEVRNIIVHEDGYASKMFFKKLNRYSKPSPLGIKNEFNSPEINFSYINQFKDKLKAFAELTDNKVRAKWKTSEITHQKRGNKKIAVIK